MKLYTDEEKEKIWNNYYAKVHKIDVEGVSNTKLIEIIRDLESENYILRNDRNYYYNLSRKSDFYRHKAHVYKIELGRCVRKLTRIYQNVFVAGCLYHLFSGTEKSGKEYVDILKRI